MDPNDVFQDVDLMEWWENVEQWKDTPQHEDMAEKEEAKCGGSMVSSESNYF